MDQFFMLKVFRLLTLQQIQTLVNSDLEPAHHHLLPVELLPRVSTCSVLRALDGC